MNKYTKAGQAAQAAQAAAGGPSLLDRMKDGQEYQSIAGLQPQNPVVLQKDMERAIAAIEAIRKHPCLCYMANVVKTLPETAISPSDHLPFSEMVSKVPVGIDEVDVLIVTPGGLAHQVTQFVNALRARFKRVEFILPYMSMSAGTLWALSGERIWMDQRAFIGPIDPQTPTKTGQLVPAQALLVLLADIQRQAEEAQKNGRPIPWHLSALIATMDQKELGNAMTGSLYVQKLAAEYLEKFKFRDWVTHKSGSPVTPDERAARALEVAARLVSHEKWKAHGHAITRDIVYQELKIVIDHIESVPGLEQAVRRMWALAHWLFDNSTTAKLYLSSNYVMVRNVVAPATAA